MLIHARTEPRDRAQKRRSLIADESGAELIEKLVMIALFIFVAVVGLNALGEDVEQKFIDQGTSISNAEDTLPPP